MRTLSVPLMTQTFLFEDEYKSHTIKRRRDFRGRLFASHVVLDVKRINSTEVRLCYIETLPNRRLRGFATDALSWLCEVADAHSIKIWLCPVRMEDESMTVCQLTHWYQKFGFKRIGCNDDMVRYPNGTRC